MLLLGPERNKHLQISFNIRIFISLVTKKTRKVNNNTVIKDYDIPSENNSQMRNKISSL